MNTDRGPDTSETAIFQSWLDRGLLHPPMVTLGWPGGAARVLPEPLFAHQIRAHLFMAHDSWPGSMRDLARLKQSHDEEHYHLLFSHFGFSGLVHVHEIQVEKQEEWEW